MNNGQNINNISSYAGNQQAALQQPFTNPEIYKQMAVNDLKKIENLVQTGVMTQEQGQNLMNYVTQKAFEKYTQLSQQQNMQTPGYAQVPPQLKNPQNINVPPDFFNRDGRIDVFEYLKNSNTAFDEDELSKISELVEKIEKTAVARYLRELEHEKTLNNENETAKRKLRANAQNSVSGGNGNLVFTREQIGKMSGAEFAKYERAIMDQLKKGLIK